MYMYIYVYINIYRHTYIYMYIVCAPWGLRLQWPAPVPRIVASRFRIRRQPPKSPAREIERKNAILTPDICPCRPELDNENVSREIERKNAILTPDICPCRPELGNENLFGENEPENAILTPDICPCRDSNSWDLPPAGFRVRIPVQLTQGYKTDPIMTCKNST